MAEVCWKFGAPVPGVAGGELKIMELGREGDARGMMSLGSGFPAEWNG